MIKSILLFSKIALLSTCVRGDCEILDADPRDGLGFSGCKSSDDLSRACFTEYLDVVYRDGDNQVRHDIMTPSEYTDQVKNGDISDIISTSVAAMRCPELHNSCFPLASETLVVVGDNIESKALEELQVGDTVVVSSSSNEANGEVTLDTAVTSQVINFAHRSISDNETARFVRIRTDSGAEVRGSSDHNIFVYHKNARMSTSFGKLAHNFVVGDFYLFSHNGGLDSIRSIDFVWERNGFVAPVTKAGTMLVRSNKDGGWIEVSCFSSVPDSLAKIGHWIRMLPTWLLGTSPNGNEPGVGSGYWMDCIAFVASIFSRAYGHVV